MNVIQPQSKPGTRCVFQVWAKTCPTNTNALDSWCERVPWMCKVLHGPATSCEMDGNYLCSPIVQITAPFLIWACPRHFWPISRLNIDAFWFVWNSLGLFSVWKQTREQEKATSLRLIVRFGPEQTDYRCENALRLSEGVFCCYNTSS